MYPSRTQLPGLLPQPVLAGVVGGVCFLGVAVLVSILAACLMNRRRAARRHRKRLRQGECQHPFTYALLTPPPSSLESQVLLGHLKGCPYTSCFLLREHFLPFAWSCCSILPIWYPALHRGLHPPGAREELCVGYLLLSCPYRSTSDLLPTEEVRPTVSPFTFLASSAFAELPVL